MRIHAVSYRRKVRPDVTGDVQEQPPVVENEVVEESETKQVKGKGKGKKPKKVKKQKKEKPGPQPTLLATSDGGDKILKFATETDELDWLKHRFATDYRSATHQDDLSKFRQHQVKWQKIAKNSTGYSANLIHRVEKDLFVATEVPCGFDGMKSGDILLMCLGGAGDRFAYACARNGIKVYRVPPFQLKEWRGKADKNLDPLLLIKHFALQPEAFQLIGPRDLELIKLTEAYNNWHEMMKERIKCEQRLQQRTVGEIFLNDSGLYPEGRIEDAYDQLKASDIILVGMFKEEANRLKELEKRVYATDVWKEIFADISGVGPKIAARLIVAIGDIRRFPTAAKFKAYCGLHVFNAQGKKMVKGEAPTEGGIFVRRRSGEVANWKEVARQAFFLVADQFNRRKESTWGVRLLEVKARMYEKHPEPVPRFDAEGKPVLNESGKQIMDFTPGHIQKRALWRVTTKFAEHLWRDWSRLEIKARQDTVVTDVQGQPMDQEKAA